MKKSQRGFSLHEIVGALAVGTLMLIGLGTMMGDSMEDMTDQQTALYQRQIADAAARYIKDDYANLLSASSSSVPITRDFSKLAPFLPSGFLSQNPYGQIPCVILLKNGTSNLDALIVTEGKSLLANPSDPKSKERKDVPYIAANAGQGAGYISGDGTSSTPAQAYGAFGSWLMPAARLATFLSKNCSGTSAGIGNLATTYFYQGPGQFTTDFLYKVEVPGRPDLNRMDAPLQLASTAYPQAVENQSDTKCVAGDTTTYGRIAVDAQNALLSCRNGIWKRQGVGSMVTSFAALPIAGNEIGEVRVVNDTVNNFTRSFVWNGTVWTPLALDELGSLAITRKITAANIGSACSPNGLVARTTNGMLLSCQAGFWKTQTATPKTLVYPIPPMLPTDFVGYHHSSGLSTTYYINIPGDLSSNIPPFFVTGEARCDAEGPVPMPDPGELRQAYVQIEIQNASNVTIGNAGGCAAGLTGDLGQQVETRGYITLTQLPANATRLKVTLRPGSGDYNYVEAQVQIYGSE